MMRGPFFPILNDYDDGSYGHPYQRASYPTRSAYAERQRWERIRAVQEQERQRQEYLRRLRRHQAEEERQAEQKQRRYSLVRGPGGMLYRVPVDSKNNAATTNESRTKKKQEPTYARGPDGSIYMVHNKQPPEHTMVDKENTAVNRPQNNHHKSPPPKATNDREVEVSDEKQDAMKQVKVMLHDEETFKNRRRVTILVEDVPESELEEDEEDETKSIWRNRRPGPGESWMEPIKA